MAVQYKIPDYVHISQDCRHLLSRIFVANASRVHIHAYWFCEFIKELQVFSFSNIYFWLRIWSITQFGGLSISHFMDTCKLQVSISASLNLFTLKVRVEQLLQLPCCTLLFKQKQAVFAFYVAELCCFVYHKSLFHFRIHHFLHLWGPIFIYILNIF